MSGVSKGMIFLETGNKIIEEAVQERLVNGKRDQGGLELTFSDFDDVNFRFTSEGNILNLQVKIPNYAQLVKYGADDLSEELGGLQTQAVSGFDVGISVDASNPPKPAEELVTKFSHIRNIIQGAPLKRAFTELASKPATASPTTPLMRYEWRRTESIFIVPQKDRVIVMFSLDFGEDTDQVMARTFLQEFVETQRSVNASPPCSFSHTPPLELRPLNLPLVKPVKKRGVTNANDVEEGIAGYISFAIFPSHVQTEEKRTKAVNMLLGFRNYLHYHIKASKTYLHMRMRLRVANLLQVLNRAIPDVEVEKKTITGKTFKRAV